ncbi:MAG: hypothetical protein HUU08_10030 [Candidatus Brocadia sp.]|nr:hypothetical protein [Candidatus Brocadia sp.]
MIRVEDLRTCVRNGIDFIKKHKEVIDAEIFASWNEQITVRLNYTSDIPCNGVHETKSTQLCGIGLLAVFKTGKEIKVGFGSSSNTITPKGIAEAFNKAKRNRIYDPDFKSLPVPVGKPVLENYHDPAVMEISDEAIVGLGWQGLKGALAEYNLKHFNKSIIIGRIWYTYPINGLAADDFTSTIIADSYIVKGGKIVKPLKPNTIRIHGNIMDILNKIIAVSNDRRQTIVWGGEEVVLSPEIAIQGVQLDSISGFIS